MAQLGITAGGAAVGALIGAPFGGALIGAELGALAGSIIGGILFPGGTPASGPVVGDLRVQTATYGKPMPLLIGTTRVTGEVIAISDLVPTAVTTTIGGGMGFGTPQQGVAAYTYSVTMLVSFGIPLMGPAVGITRIWANNKKIHDTRPNGSHGRLRGAKLRKYLGTSTQLPDPWLQSKAGAAITSAYRGQVYIALEHLQLADFFNTPPTIEAEVVCAGSNAYPFQTVNPGGISNFDNGLLINSDLGIILKMDFDGTIVTVDTQTLNVVAGPVTLLRGTSYSATPVFGSDGFLYAANEENAGSGNNYIKWSKIDPTSLQIVQQIGYDAVFEGPGHNGLPIATYVKCRNSSYFLGCCGTGLPSFSSVGAVIVSTGQLEALAAGTPTGGDLPMRFVGKTEASAGPDPLCQDWEIDALSLSNSIAAQTLPITFDLWGVFGDPSSHTCTLYHFVVTDNFALGGGLVAGGGHGTNPIVLADTIDISSAWSVSGSAAMTYMDSGEHALIIGRGAFFGKMIKFNLDSRTVTGAELDVGGISSRQLAQGPTNGLLYCGLGGNLNILDVSNWDIQSTIALTNFGGALYSNPQWDDKNGTLWVQEGSTLYELTLGAIAGTGVVLGDAVKALCKLGGLTDARLDTSALTDTLRGYAVPRQTSIKNALKPLADAFLFEAYEADFKLKFAKLGAATVGAPIPFSDIGAYQSSAQRPEPLVITDTNQRQIPRRVTVKSIDPDLGSGYRDSLQAAQRHQPLVTTVSELAMDVPVVLSEDEAENVANAWLARSWVNARQIAFSTSPKYLRLTPTDVVPVVDKYGKTHQVAIKQIDAGADGTFKVSAVREDPESYVPAAPAGSGGVGGPSPGDAPSRIGHTDAELMDIVLISDAHDGKGFYLAMAPDTGDPTAWLGGVLMKSSDNGGSFVAFQTLSVAANMGRATTVLAAPRAWTTWDKLNSVTVRLFDSTDDTLSSTSEMNVLNGANLAALGNELIAFAAVVNNGDGTFTLSDLLRGLRGSDPFIGTHTIGDRFVLVDFTKIRNIADPDFGVTRVYKTQSVGDTTIPATSQMFTDTGVRLMPLTVAEPQVQADAEGNLLLSWNRRTRIGGENDWLDGVTTVPLGEASEAYQVDILKAGVVVRTISVASPQAAYMLTDQVADFGSAQTAVNAVIYQISATVGQGFGTAVGLSVVGPSALPALPTPVIPTPPPGIDPFLIVMEWLDTAPIPAGQVIGRFKADSTFVIPAGMGGSTGDAKDAATSTADIDVRQNGSSFGTVVCAAATNALTFISAAGATFNSGDLLEFVAPATPDATLGRITVTIKALQSS